jgi:hypothetical protein
MARLVSDFRSLAMPAPGWSIWTPESTRTPGLPASFSQDRSPTTPSAELYPNLQNINVTSFIKSLVEAGATHAGFMFRDVETADGARTINHFIVVQDTTTWAGDTPPSLALTLIPEPSTAVLSIGAAVLLLRRRRHG